MPRDLLIIHPVQIAREIIKRAILSDLTDVSLFESETLSETFDLLENKRFDLIICCHDYRDFQGTEVYEHLKAHPLNQDTQILALVYNYSEETLQKLKLFSIDHILEVPSKLKEIGKSINLACAPGAMRTNSRYHIPGLKLMIDFFDEMITFPTLNISSHGALCEIEYNAKINWFEIDLISIIPPDEHPELQLENIPSRYLRSEVTEWNFEHNIPQKMQVVWFFHQLNEKQQQEMNRLLHTADSYIQTEIWE